MMAQTRYRVLAGEDIKAGQGITLQYSQAVPPKPAAFIYDPTKEIMAHGFAVFDTKKGEDLIFVILPIRFNIPSLDDLKGR